jgi:hypothetical protein
MSRPYPARGARWAVAALLLTTGCGDDPCDPHDWLLPDEPCDDDQTCDAATLTCVDRRACSRHEDCADGYVCYSAGYCARNCQAGFFVLSQYCVDGFVCDRDTLECVPESGAG